MRGGWGRGGAAWGGRAEGASSLRAAGAADGGAAGSGADGGAGFTAIPGDVSDPAHQAALVEAAGPQIDLLVNNASLLGPSPQPPLADYPPDTLRRVYEVNVIAPLSPVQLALPRLPAGAGIVNLPSHAAVEPYEGWGRYGSSKAA